MEDLGKSAASFGQSSLVAIPKLPESLLTNNKMSLDTCIQEQVLDESDCF